MDDLRTQQIEALEVAQDYIKRLLPGMQDMVKELKGERREDTDEYLKFLMNGLNWVIEVFNGTMSLINEKEIKIDKDAVNKDIMALSIALQRRDDLQAAVMLETGVIPFLNRLLEAAGEAVA